MLVERVGAWLAKRLRDRYAGDQLRLRTRTAALTGIGVGIVTGTWAASTGSWREGLLALVINIPLWFLGIFALAPTALVLSLDDWWRRQLSRWWRPQH